jgi:hypothetical protein
MKTLEKQQAQNEWIKYQEYHKTQCNYNCENNVCLKDAFLAGYKLAFEIGLMKGGMNMQSLLDGDCHFVVKKNG